MKKILIFITIIFMILNISSFAGKVEEQLREKGLHVADLTDEDKINLQINKLQQSIQLQLGEDISMILSPQYSESDPSINRSSIGEKLEGYFNGFAQVRKFNTQFNPETGWKATATQDFYIRNIKIDVLSDKAIADCEIGFYSSGTDYQDVRDTLIFEFTENTWLLYNSKNLFGFLDQASKDTKATTGTPSWGAAVMHGTKDDFSSSSLLVPEILFYHNGNPIPRFNFTTCLNLFSYYDTDHQQWHYINIMNAPYGILADVMVTPGGNDPLNHDFLFVSDITSNKIVGTQMNSWIAEYTTPGEGQGRFQSPHGIACLASDYFFVAGTLNDTVSVYEYENGWEDPIFQFSLANGFNQPRDVEVKEGEVTVPPTDETRIVVADTKNHRLAFYLWTPYPICFDRFYGQPGSDVGRFIEPTSVCFGRYPEHIWQTNDVFVTDSGNHRLVWLYITSESINWKATYQFPSDVDLTSVEVDNRNLVYVVDRRHSRIYKLAAAQNSFQLLGIWGGTGVSDGQLDYPNMIEVAHGRQCPPPCSPLSLGDVFVTELWGQQTGLRRFVIGSDVLNLTAGWVPYNESTGGGNYIWWNYSLTDFGTVTEQVKHSAEVCTTYNRGTINYGYQAGTWPVDGHEHGTTYTVKITATSIYDPSIAVEKSVDVYVDTISTHDPIITQGLRCHLIDSTGILCNACDHCIREWEGYRINVQAYDPDGDPLTYKWSCGRGYFRLPDLSTCNPCSTDENEICYVAPEAPGERPPVYEYINVTVRDIYDGWDADSYYPTIHESGYSCICGDVTGNGIIDAGDVLSLIGYLYQSGTPPAEPWERADANNSCELEAGDVTALINYLYSSGPHPVCCWIH